MSFKYPKRVKDLPRLESDSEDDLNTPHKLRTTQASSAATTDHQDHKIYCNKENEHNYSNSSHNKNITSFSQFRNFPKRRSELPALESDSDDDNLRDESLNCAILNDSFILTPVKDELHCSPCNLSTQNQLDTVDTNRLVTQPPSTDLNAANSSFVNYFNKMGLCSDPPAENTPKPIIPKDYNPSSTSSSFAVTQSTHKNTVQKPLISNTASKSIADDKEPAAAVKRVHSEPTPYADEAQFATPQIRSFSVHRRPRDICSTHSEKARSAIVNEFRSQKVLFQTPMAITRAPNSCLPNDSINLSSLCDSLNDHQSDTLGTTEKYSPESSTTSLNIKSKKSLDGIFKDVEESEANSKKIESVTNATASTSKMATEAPCKPTILEINKAKYTILQKLGAGGSSSVYLAQRKDNGRECALKIVNLRGDAAIVEGYLNETKLLAKLQGNVCIVSLYEYQLMQSESKLYMVMEKGDSDLSKILQSYKTNLPLYVLMNFWYQMLQAVNYIHQNGVIHSDLKPANFLMVNGRLKLIDFGIASNIAVDSTSIIKFSQAGTFNYISPEALTDTSTASSPIRNQPKIKISTKSDVWSLGCILYLLLYKKTPFSHILSIYAKISAISSPNPSIDYPAVPAYYPPMLLHMAKSCLQHNPKQRPSCADLLQYPFHMVIPIKNLTVPPK